MIIRKLLWFSLIAVAGCSASQANIAQSDLNTVLSYGPPYTVTKLQEACAASAQAPTDKVLKVECVKLSVFAKGCELSIPQIAGGVNTGLTLASSVVPQVTAVLTANQVVVPVLEATQLAACTTGGFIVSPTVPAVVAPVAK